MSKTLRVTKEFGFETAHALWGYDGKCKHIHGHSYRLQVTVKGEPIDDASNPKLGMVVDFGDLKKLVNEVIVDVFDHALVLSNHAPVDAFGDIPEMFERVMLTEYQPTAEMMILDFAERLKTALPNRLKLYSLRLNETPVSFVEWFANDN